MVIPQHLRIEVIVNIGVNRYHRLRLREPGLELNPLPAVGQQVAGLRPPHIQRRLCQRLVLHAVHVDRAVLHEQGGGIKGNHKVGSQEQHVIVRLFLPVVHRQHRAAGFQGQQDSGFLQRRREAGFESFRDLRAFRIDQLQLQGNQLPVDLPAPHVVPAAVIGLSGPVQRPAGFVQQLRRPGRIKFVCLQAFQRDAFPFLPDLFLLFFRQGFIRFQGQRAAGNLVHPLSQTVVSVHLYAVLAHIVPRQRVLVQAQRNRLPHGGIRRRRPGPVEGDKAQPLPGIGALGIFGAAGRPGRAVPDHVRPGHLVQQAVFAPHQFVNHGIRVGHPEHDPRNHRLQPVRVPLVVGVQFEARFRPVEGQHAVRAAHDGRVGQVSVLFIQQRALQQLRRKERFGFGVFPVPDIGSLSVVPHFALGRDHMDRIGVAVQQARFIEVRQIFRPDPDLQLILSDHPQPCQAGRLSFRVFLPSGDIIRMQALPADFVDQRRGAQQPAEGIVPGGDRRAVGIVHVLIQRDAVDMVPFLVPQDHASLGHHGGIQPESALLGVPFHQVVAVNQLPHIHVAAGVSPVIHGEGTVHGHHRADDQLIVVVYRGRGYCRRQRLPIHNENDRKGRGHKHRQHQQKRQKFLHTIPLIASRSAKTAPPHGSSPCGGSFFFMDYS